MRKIYRLWFPQAGIHGSDFNQLCPKCQREIANEIEKKLVLPTSPSIHIDEEVTLLLGYSESASICGVQVIFCKQCSATFKKWLLKLDYLHVSNKPIELWISTLAEEEKEGIKVEG